jgi:hypothetical protein
MVWILIVFFGYRGGVGVVEFNTREACENGRHAIEKNIDPKYASGLDLGSLICLPKGKKAYGD